MTRMFRIIPIVLAALSMVVVFTPVAHAQTERRVGIVIAYPSSIGVQWQTADRVTLRIDGGYDQWTSEAISEFRLGSPFPASTGPERRSLTLSSGTRTIDVGVSLLFDVHRSDELRVYVAPRAGVSFVHQTNKTEYDGDPADLAFVTLPADEEFGSKAPVAALALGASHDVSSRLRVFAEAGWSYSRRESEGEYRFSTFGLRGGVGAVILF